MSRYNPDAASSRVCKILLSREQARFITSTKTLRGFVSGRGAGKTFAGAFDLIYRAKPDRLYSVVAPTFKVLRDATHRTFLEVAEQIPFGRLDDPYYDGLPLRSIRQVSRTAWVVQLRNKADVLFRSGERAERLRGGDRSGVWLEEASVLSRDAFDILIGTLRESGELGWLSATFTPKGKRHWTYDVFGPDEHDKVRPNVGLFHSSTTDNPFLPPEFSGLLASQYTSRTQQQELGGIFLDEEGQVFHASWFRHIAPLPPPNVIRRVRYWDTAATQDGGSFTAGVLMSEYNNFYFVENVVRGQWSSGRRNAIILATARLDGAMYPGLDIWIEQEPGGGGKSDAESIVAMLTANGFLAHRHPVTTNKRQRIEPFAAACENGKIILVRSQHTGDWIEDFISELVAFPNEPNDQGDAAGGCYLKLARPVVPGIAVGAPRTPLPPQLQPNLVSGRPGYTTW